VGGNGANLVDIEDTELCYDPIHHLFAVKSF
jgi:hypothetical protein